MDWKPFIIQLTEHPNARKAKIDASFFPPCSEAEIAAWETEKELSVPDQIRSYLLTSNGLEAQRGEIWPVLALQDWDTFHDECASPDPWIQFGETIDYRYLISLGHSPSIYRYPKFGSDEAFFANSFQSYLEKIFRDEG